MRISDWSSDVCSSDLQRFERLGVVCTEKATDGQGVAEVSQHLGHVHALAGGVAVHGIAAVDLARFQPHQFHREIERRVRSEEHTSELQSLMRISYAVFCLKKKKNNNETKHNRARTHTN